LPLSRQAIV